MILRRLTSAFRKQAWFTVGVEMLIVVFGVFIGIQVANWNEARVDAGRAQAYLERISLDLDADLAALADRQRFWREIVDRLAGNSALMEELRYWMSTMHVAQLIANDRIAAATALKTMTASNGVASSGSKGP